MRMFFGDVAASAATSAAKDYSSAAVAYFTSIRVPAALIAGSSMANLFTLVDESADGGEAKRRTQLQTLVLIAYHVLTLTSLLLSLNVIVTSTATANSMLFGMKDPMASSVFALLKREYEFEFQLTRASFFVGILSFLAAIAARALVQFELLTKRRLSSAILVLSSFGTLFFHLVSYINASLLCYENLGAMVWSVLKTWFYRSVSGRMPAELASICCFFCFMGSAVSLVRRSGRFSSHSESVSTNGCHVGDNGTVEDDSSAALEESL